MIVETSAGINSGLKTTKSKRGFTLTEIAIVLGIIGLILGAIWAAASSVYANQRVTHANTAVLQIVQGTRALFSTSSSVGTAGDITSNLISANVIPTDLVSGAAANSVWPGGTTNVLTVAATDIAFTVQMTNVPKTACVNLLSVIGGTVRDAGLYSVGATTASAPVVVATAGTALPVLASQVAVITPAIAVAACTGATNVVQFEFSLK